jgi:hypothetical protein
LKRRGEWCHDREPIGRSCVFEMDYNVDMVPDTVYLGTRHQELAVISLRTNLITVFFLPVSDVYISTSIDSDPCTVCGSEVNITNLIS